MISRLRYIMELRRLSQRRLALLLRIDPSNLSKVLSGKLPFTEGLVNRIVVDLGISKKWLTTGEGVPFEKSAMAADIPLDTPVAPTLTADGTPVYDLDVTAGCRSLESLFGENRPVGSINIPGVARDSNIVKVSGDSMSPRINNGGYIAIRPVSSLRNIFWGQIYVVELDDYRMVKYLRRHPDPEMVILHSDNPDYDDMDVPRSDIRSLYIVEAILNYELKL
ncbi:MAG: hypothetical protein NC039_04455 [Muribaculaceae bacterium]|nr:hypothetical protein [Muribaculaceae bacterium]